MAKDPVHPIKKNGARRNQDGSWTIKHHPSDEWVIFVNGKPKYTTKTRDEARQACRGKMNWKNGEEAMVWRKSRFSGEME